MEDIQDGHRIQVAVKIFISNVRKWYVIVAGGQINLIKEI